jgi:hypothetical protein
VVVTDLVNWRHRATFQGPAGDRATSIAVFGNQVYVGTSSSNIYKMAAGALNITAAVPPCAACRALRRDDESCPRRRNS